MDKYCSAFLGSSQVFEPLNRTIFGSIDRFAVDREPIANRPQSLLKFRLNDAVGLRANIEQEVAAAARDLNQAANEEVSRFVIQIIFVIGPCVVNGHAGLP